MIKTVHVSVFTALILGLCFLLSTAMASEPVNIVKGNNKFGADLFKIASRNEGNILISPFSAHVVLSMAYQGACNNTADRMQKALSLPAQDVTATQYHDIILKTNKVASVTLDVANKIYLMEAFKLRQEFKNIIATKFLAEAEELNFEENEKSAKVINDWVTNKTKEKITNLIDSRMLNKDTRLVLVNAVYFKGNWTKPFNKGSTKKEPFYLLNGDEIMVDMMHIESKFRYQENDELNCKILELPYEGNELSMLIFLPNERNGITQLQEKMSDIDLSDVVRHFDLLTVNVALPKFKIESTIPLNSALIEMGMEIMFSNDANFCKIAKNGEELKVSDVIQKTFIEVNEEGTEAAAATGLMMVMRCMPMPVRQVSFQADHPFLIALVHKADEHNILFYGRVSSPATHHRT